MSRSRGWLVVAPVLVLLVPSPAFAYVGPGAGLTAIGAFVAFIGAMLLALLGFVWYPIRRLFRALRGKPPVAPSAPAAAEASVKTPGD